MAKVNIYNQVVRDIGFLIAPIVFVFMGTKIVKKVETYKRANDFYKYIMEKPSEYLEPDCPENYVVVCKEQPAMMQEYLVELVEDSVKYAKVVKKDANVINTFSKTISFEEAFNELKQENCNIVINSEIAKMNNDKLKNVRGGMALAKSEQEKNR